MDTHIEHYLEAHASNMVSFLREILQIPTINPPGDNYLECAQLLQRKLEEAGFQTQLLEVPQAEANDSLPECAGHPRYNVLGRLQTGAAKTVHFNGHYDVVPVSGQWTHPPFAGKMADGCIYGRGASDMKGSLAALCHALEAISSLGKTPAFNLEVSFVCDEEVGGKLGMGFLTKNKMIKADYGVVCEGASGPHVGIGHNGALWLKVELNGKPAHASRPQEGVNAFEQMAQLTQRLFSYKDALNKIRFTAPNGDIMNPTLNLGGDFGGNPGAKTNTVPSTAWFTLDRRILVNESFEQVEHELREFIRAAAENLPGCQPVITSLHSARPYLLSASHPLIQSFGRAITSARGWQPRYHVTPGFTDARFFSANGLGIPAIGYGVDGHNHHGVDEYVSLEELLRTAKVYAAFITEGIRTAEYMDP